MNPITESSYRYPMAVIGVPSSAGARQRGQERAPDALRSAGLLESLQSAGLNFQDFGNLPLLCYEPDRRHPNCQNLKLVSAVARQVADRVESAFRPGRKILVIGGDCTITLGVLAGISRQIRNPGLLYFDGDIDMNTPEDSPTGILDGMVLAHITGHVANELSGIGTSQPLVPEERIAVFGYNPDAGWIDPGEKARFDQTSILKFSVGQIRDSISESAVAVLNILKARAGSYIVHFDVDVLDDLDFPAADVPHRYGVPLSAAVTALQVFWSAPECVALVITEFNPNRDPEGVYANRLVDALVRALPFG